MYKYPAALIQSWTEYVITSGSDAVPGCVETPGDRHLEFSDSGEVFDGHAENPAIDG